MNGGKEQRKERLSKLSVILLTYSWCLHTHVLFKRYLRQGGRVATPIRPHFHKQPATFEERNDTATPFDFFLTKK